MPNTIDIYAGMIPDLSEKQECWAFEEEQPRQRRSSARIARLSRITGRLRSVLL